ncbi:metallophosphoesterase [Pseudomonas sp. 10B1]|uniref:metallophosphoesterase family protein n=1 Tax=unclassified Pseudomonas TaxID=196821 RepID=UPI002B236276|nr:MULTISPECIES: metallophosphoesterase [unclassified Pseudomonas]MEA9995041.1 metallophosphoesterase [Pseudomonas sp. AA4]MEB0088760.1 metallophosphoesterase [Pseudomonas sp. RTI1]MEB0126843.1 metallophosphoesterase [Pseudomonas sp. CCC1.2]MEB0152494.1 metallophosphoesterase [Pseudomonas sp. CCC4.3]MEB0219597.1 metallophosphoesterase [Pseudomonas sp. AB12(2023)]
MPNSSFNLPPTTKRLACIALLLCAVVVPATYAGDTPTHMVFASDPQYPWTDKSEDGSNESSSVRDARSAAFIVAQYTSIQTFRDQHGGGNAVPVMINGDMTAYGHASERSYVRETLASLLNNQYDYGLGNHDYANNVDDCLFNACAGGSVSDFIDRYWGKVDNMDLAAKDATFGRSYYGSLAYSRTMGQVHWVQLNNEPTYHVNFTAGNALLFNKREYEITHALDWLERDLQGARASAKIIILNMHKPGRWSGDDHLVQRFRDMIQRYGVVAVFAGHKHLELGQYDGDLRRFGEVPVFLSGAAFRQSYLIATLSDDKTSLTVSVVEKNDWRARRPVATLKIH